MYVYSGSGEMKMWRGKGAMTSALVLCVLAFCLGGGHAQTSNLGTVSMGSEIQNSTHAAVLVWNPPVVDEWGSPFVTFSSNGTNTHDVSTCCWQPDVGDTEPYVEFDLRGERYLLGARVQVYSPAADLTNDRCQNYTISTKTGTDAFTSLGTYYTIPYPADYLDMFLDASIKCEFVRITCTHFVGTANFNAALLLGRAILEDTLQAHVAYNVNSYKLVLDNPGEVEGGHAFGGTVETYADYRSVRIYGDGYHTTYLGGFAGVVDPSLATSEFGASVGWAPLSGTTVADHTFLIDLGAKGLVVGVVVETNSALTFEIKGSTDYSTWFAIQQFAVERDVGFYYFDLAASARYVKIAVLTHSAASTDAVVLQMAPLTVEGIADVPCCSAVNTTDVWCCMVSSGMISSERCDSFC